MKAVRARPTEPAEHRHFAGLVREHEFEPVPGLPELLPEGERILWQGAPEPGGLAVDAFHLRKVAVYFGVLIALRMAWAWPEIDGITSGLNTLVPLAPLALVALGLLAALAALSARSALYTVTNKRVVMRIGIVLTLTYNLPMSRIEAADFRDRGDGTGDLSLRLKPGDHIAWLNLWPHARAWRLARPEPTLRNVRGAAGLVRVLTTAWQQETGQVNSGAIAAAEPRAATRPTTEPGFARS
jgi:Bacterial PH domain